MSVVRELMTPAPFTGRPFDAVAEIRRRLLRTGVHCVPIVGDDGEAIGVVSSWDLIEESGHDDLAADVMTRAVLAVGMDEDVATAASIMMSNFVHHLVVVDEHSSVIGVLSSIDLLSELVD